MKSAHLTRTWANTTLDGFCFVTKRETEAAARSWIEACDRLDRPCHDDAVTAVALSNAAVGNVLLHRPAAARAAFLACEGCWHTVAASLEVRELPIAATSSSFHFRLAGRDTETFTRLRRQRYMRLCCAGHEIVRFNRLQADLNDNGAKLAARSRELQVCLTHAFGASWPEVILLSVGGDGHGKARESLYEAKAAAFNRTIETAKIPLDFWTRLECAVRLAAVLIPPIAPVSVSQTAHRG